MQPFRWSVFVYSLFGAAIIMFLFGIVMDNALRLFGLNMSSWFNALWDSLQGMFFGFFLAPVFWRIGLVTLPQYLLGAFALVVPITGISVIGLSQFQNIWIELPGFDREAYPNQYIAITAYVRLIRSMIFVPVFLAGFYWIYHVVYGMAPRTKSDD